jgi:acrylyl-CoA reductase (NADPH)
MAIGTAGYTAMLALMALEEHQVTPERGPVLVTGASGGVGSFAISLLARAGYRVIASTGRLEQASYLQQLGAAEIIDRQELALPGRPLASERWAGAIDAVGSHTLANVCASTSRGGAVAACGLAQGMDLPATVAPFILRGVSLLGIDSGECPQARRLAAWTRLASMADATWFEQITRDIALGQAIEHAALLLDNQVRGRLVVDVNAP